MLPKFPDLYCEKSMSLMMSFGFRYSILSVLMFSLPCGEANPSTFMNGLSCCVGAFGSSRFMLIWFVKSGVVKSFVTISCALSEMLIVDFLVYPKTRSLVMTTESLPEMFMTESPVLLCVAPIL